jgi:nicotinamidase/pyrazinamidase
MRALIIVDIQNDFTTGGNLAVPEGENIIATVNTLQHKVDLVVATQDWHPPDHKSFASNHQAKKPFEKINLNGLEQVLWPNHCVQGSAGAEFHPQLNINGIEAIFRKGMDRDIDSYSGFFDNGHKKTTGLAGYLKERKVKSVYVCGLAADYCVYFTALDSIQEGFKTFIIEDATKAITSTGFDQAKTNIRSRGGQLAISKTLL